MLRRANDPPGPSDDDYRSQARYEWSGSDLQVDPLAEVHRIADPRGGAWVQAWVWVELETVLEMMGPVEQADGY